MANVELLRKLQARTGHMQQNLVSDFLGLPSVGKIDKERLEWQILVNVQLVAH